ncbi:hypothetical protein Clacol_004760 [Clathrus columnatus]|uniref:Uncharacterized protein n=1 Tax=Clathrus columnatus TaxID=1419009 RepID=A0AAV5AAM7_9AGAM|nr:hypothetical protein Clacol_004760 [Clathrus columnatus]
MPSRRETRNNAIPDPQYAFLGLHQAALSGNVGLVEYALSEGQPVDAVWDGISALHAAAAGGSEHVARLLIENGADVNLGSIVLTFLLKAASPDSSIPPERSEALLNPGSTPLHYACAHNNTAVARLLLAAGAAPHVPDKRGVTPLDLLPPTTAVPSSHSLGSSPPADTLRAVIREYYENEKAKEKEFNKSQSNQTLRSQTKSGSILGVQRLEDEADLTLANSSSNPNDMLISIPLASKRVPVKRSLENLLSMGLSVSPKHISPPSSSTAVSTISSRKSPPPSPAKFTFGTATQIGTPTHLPSRQTSPPPPPFVYSERRPSLPHAFTVSSTLSSSQPQMPIQQLSLSASDESSRPRSADGRGAFPHDESDQSTAVPLLSDSHHTSSPSVRSPPPHLTSFDAPRHSHSHHTHTHSATLPTAALPSPTVAKPPRMKRSLLSLFGKNRDEKEDHERDRSRSKEKDKEKERERSFSRPSFSTLSRPSFSAFGSNGGPAPIPLPSRPSPIPIPPRAHTSISNSGSSQLATVPPSETVNEVHTAPAERTSFNTVIRSSRLKHADEDEDEEEYGVELRRRGGVYDYIENDEAASDEESEEWEAEEEMASTSEDESEDEHQDEKLIINSREINVNGNKSIETPKHVMDSAPEDTGTPSVPQAQHIISASTAATPTTTHSTPLPPATTSSPTQPSILHGLNNGGHYKTSRTHNSNDTTCGLRRSGSLRFELNNGHSVNQSETTKNVITRDHKASDRSFGVGSPDREPKTSLESIVARRSGEGARSPIIRKKSSLGLKERGSSGILREGTVDSSPVKRTPQTGMMTLPRTVSPSKYRTSSSDSKVATQPTKERSRKSNSLSRRSPRTAIPPLPMPIKVIEATHPNAANVSYIAGCSSASEDESSRHRTCPSHSKNPISVGVNLRSVSSHAEAEALVKLAAKEIIAMASNPNEFNGDIPQMSLAEQLARYGETLQIERRFARGEAQRWKNVNDESGVDDQTIGPDEENKWEARKAVEEEERRRKVRERMMWSQRNLDRYAKAENKDKDKERIKDKDKDKQDTDFGYILQRTTSHEKDDARISPLPFTKGLSPNGFRRPHTSDSVQSNASGSTVTPPRFGHNSTHSSSNIRFTPANQPLRVFQRETPRSGSFDYDRPKFSTTNPISGRRSEDLYRKRYKETEADEERDHHHQQEPNHFGFTMPASQNQLPAPVPGNITSSPSSITPVLPDASITTTNTSTIDDWGSTAGQPTVSGTTRPLKQRFGLKSLFGKNK